MKHFDSALTKLILEKKVLDNKIVRKETLKFDIYLLLLFFFNLEFKAVELLYQKYSITEYIYSAKGQMSLSDIEKDHSVYMVFRIKNLLCIYT